jgi:multidrug efflux pump subunit AcrB
VFRLSVPSTGDGFPVYGFPIDFAIEDRGDHGSAILLQRAEALVEKMNKSGKFSAAEVVPGRHQLSFAAEDGKLVAKFSAAEVVPGLRQAPYLNMDIDRAKCLALGVEISEIFNTLQVYLGSYYINDFNQFGRTWQVNVQVDRHFRKQTSDILKLQVRNKQNQLVQLGTVMAVRDTTGPVMVTRYNMYPAAVITGKDTEGVSLQVARITANLAEGVSLQEAKSLCDTLAEQELGKGFKQVWPSR